VSVKTSAPPRLFTQIASISLVPFPYGACLWVLILALSALPAVGQDQHRGVQAGGVGSSRALGNNDLDKEDIACRMLGLQQYRSR
jgi:hypothetical protein